MDIPLFSHHKCCIIGITDVYHLRCTILKIVNTKIKAGVPFLYHLGCQNNKKGSALALPLNIALFRYRARLPAADNCPAW